jgi:hypothetical protein
MSRSEVRIQSEKVVVQVVVRSDFVRLLIPDLDSLCNTPPHVDEKMSARKTILF